jgi:UDP-perosamine 4-acetyltransferase
MSSLHHSVTGTMKVVIVGGGGHARSMVDALRTAVEPFEPIACTDPSPSLRGGTIDGVPILGDDDILPRLLSDGVTYACIGVGGVGDNRTRASVYEHLASLGFVLPSVVHGLGHVSRSAILGAADVVLAGAIVGAQSRLGDNVIVNSGAIVEHGCRIGDHVHLASRSVLGGAVVIGTGAHIGLGATVIQGCHVGDNAVVGAGAVVIRDVTAGDTVVGCPAIRKQPRT